MQDIRRESLFTILHKRVSKFFRRSANDESNWKFSTFFSWTPGIYTSGWKRIPEYKVSRSNTGLDKRGLEEEEDGEEEEEQEEEKWRSDCWVGVKIVAGSRDSASSPSKWQVGGGSIRNWRPDRPDISPIARTTLDGPRLANYNQLFQLRRTFSGIPNFFSLLFHSMLPLSSQIWPDYLFFGGFLLWNVQLSFYLHSNTLFIGSWSGLGFLPRLHLEIPLLLFNFSPRLSEIWPDYPFFFFGI